jgi:hypothetical protein
MAVWYRVPVCIAERRGCEGRAQLDYPERRLERVWGDQYRALTLLAGSLHGRTASVLTRHGFGPELQAELVGVGLASMRMLSLWPDDDVNAMKIFKITQAGQAALAQARPLFIQANGQAAHQARIELVG